MTLAERRSVTGISSQRAEIIVAGGLILEGAMQALQINALHTCDWALREGVIIDHLSEWEDESKLQRTHFTDQKMRGVDAVGRRFGYEIGHASGSNISREDLRRIGRGRRSDTSPSHADDRGRATA